MTDYESRITGLHVQPVGGEIFAESAFRIYIDNEGAGEYVAVEEIGANTKIGIDRRQWPVVRDAIERMIGECRK